MIGPVRLDNRHHNEMPGGLPSLKVPPPPPEWVDLPIPIAHRARVLVFWESTVFLIENEKILCENQLRFLATVLDHKVTAFWFRSTTAVAKTSSAGVRRPYSKCGNPSGCANSVPPLQTQTGATPGPLLLLRWVQGARHRRSGVRMEGDAPVSGADCTHGGLVQGRQGHRKIPSDCRRAGVGADDDQESDAGEVGGRFEAGVRVTVPNLSPRSAK